MKRGASFEIIYKNLDANTRRRIDDSIEEFHQTHTKAVKEAEELESRCGLKIIQISPIILVLLGLLLFVSESPTESYGVCGLLWLCFVVLFGLSAYLNTRF